MVGRVGEGRDVPPSTMTTKRQRGDGVDGSYRVGEVGSGEWESVSRWRAGVGWVAYIFLVFGGWLGLGT